MKPMFEGFEFAQSIGMPATTVSPSTDPEVKITIV
jgi:hypothetical protein